MGCRAIELSRNWVVAQMGCRANEMSRDWNVAQLGGRVIDAQIKCRSDGMSRWKIVAQMAFPPSVFRLTTYIFKAVNKT